MRLRLTPQAVRQLAAIGDHIREKNPAAAKRVRAAIQKSLKNLTAFPRMGRRKPYRECAR
jgi:plasmid stabilization system protein ParE